MTEQELRRRFNSGGYWRRARSGDLQQRVLKSKPTRLANEPPGTLSQIVAYQDGPDRIALVHQYLRSNGSLGASGRLDPKELFDGGVIYFV